MDLNSALPIVIGLLLTLLFLMAMFAKLFRKAGPHEAIIVYGFPRHPRRQGPRHRDLPHGGERAVGCRSS